MLEHVTDITIILDGYLQFIYTIYTKSLLQ